MSLEGTLVYGPRPGGVAPDDRRTLVWVDEAGDEERLGQIEGPLFSPTVSPDGRQVAYSTEAGGVGIHLLDVATGETRRLTNENPSFMPVWSPDGRQIVFSSGREGAQDRDLYLVDVDGGSSGRLLHSSSEALYPIDWAGSSILFASLVRTPADFDIHRLDARTRESEVIANGDEVEYAPSYSPDGRWIAYAANEAGLFQLYVRRSDGAASRWQITSGGGTLPRWSPTDDAVYYRADSAMWAARLELTADEARVVDRRRLFDDTGYYSSLGTQQDYDVDPRTGRLLMIKRADASGPQAANRPHLVVVLNWFEELKRLAPPGD